MTDRPGRHDRIVASLAAGISLTPAAAGLIRDRRAAEWCTEFFAFRHVVSS